MATQHAAGEQFVSTELKSGRDCAGTMHILTAGGPSVSSIGQDFTRRTWQVTWESPGGPPTLEQLGAMSDDSPLAPLANYGGSSRVDIDELETEEVCVEEPGRKTAVIATSPPATAEAWSPGTASEFDMAFWHTEPIEAEVAEAFRQVNGLHCRLNGEAWEDFGARLVDREITATHLEIDLTDVLKDDDQAPPEMPVPVDEETAHPEVPAPVLVDEAAFPPDAGKPAARSRMARSGMPWLGGVIGVLVGSTACFGFWLAGLEPPARWRLASQGAPAVSFTQRSPLAADGSAANVASGASRPSDSELGGDETGARLPRTLRQALQLAQAGRYCEAVAALPRTEDPSHSQTLADEMLVRNTTELASYWQLQDALARSGCLSPQHNPVSAVHSLLASNRRLSDTLQTVRSKLQPVRAAATDDTVVIDVDRLLIEREAAAKRIQKLETALRVAREASRAGEEAMARLKAARGQLARDDEVMAYRHYSAGRTLYLAGRYLRAQAEFQAAVDGDPADARYQYYLGLARWSQGAHRAAADNFRQGARLERDHKPSRVFVSAALEELPEEAVRALAVYRP
jgi:TolA-binding protein